MQLSKNIVLFRNMIFKKHIVEKLTSKHFLVMKSPNISQIRNSISIEKLILIRSEIIMQLACNENYTNIHRVLYNDAKSVL